MEERKNESKGLNLTMIFEAESANYGEGIGNVASLKNGKEMENNILTYQDKHFVIIL